MKKVTTLILTFSICGIALAQSNGIKITQSKSQYSKNDTEPKVIYQKQTEKPLIEVNGKFYSAETLLTIKSEDIESVNVVKGNFENNGKNYSGKIIVKTKSTFNPNLITINQLVAKYTNLINGENYIFSINGEIVNTDENSTLVDEKNVMQIKVIKLDEVKNLKNMNFVKILTRTEQNLNQANQIIIRGKEITMN